MTATQTPPAARPTGAPGGRLRRHRSTLLIGGALLVAVVLAVVVGVGARTSTPMDPDNPGPDGTRAVSRVLADQGVDVAVARGADELDAIGLDASTTVAVVLPEQLGTTTIERLQDAARDAARVVVVGAGPGVSDELGVPGGGSTVALGAGREADCDDPLLDGLRIEVDSASTYPGGTCFRGTGGAVVAEPDERLLLLGADQALTNDQVLRADNAAVALRLLGQTDRLVWYVPSVDDLLGDDGTSLESLLPRWLRPGLALALLVAVAVVVWRGRRLGPLASEPLPVVVRAVETTRSLGRMYRRAGDREHAAAALRRAARARLAERLRLGTATPAETVVREVARRTGRDPAEVERLLGPDGAVPPTDPDLITLANDLAELDREVRRT